MDEADAYLVDVDVFVLFAFTMVASIFTRSALRIQLNSGGSIG